MCIQRSTIFLIISLMVINSCNNQLLSADTADLKQKLPFDIFYVIFEHGTETTNQNLSRTCTTLNNLRRCYRENRSSAYNQKFKNINCVYLCDDVDITQLNETELSNTLADFGNALYFIDSILIFPGGKRCVIRTIQQAQLDNLLRNSNDSKISINTKQYIDLDKFLNNDFTDYSDLIGKLDAITDIKRRYFIKSTHFKNKNHFIEFTLPFTGRAFITKCNNAVLNGNSWSLSIDNSKSASIIQNSPVLYPHEISFVRLDHDNLTIVTLHTKTCTLAEHTFSYHALLSSLAHTEYITDCWTITNRPEFDIPEIPLTVKHEVFEQQYRLKKDSLLHDMRAQKSLYTILSKGVHVLKQEIYQKRYSSPELIEFYACAALWLNDHDNNFAQCNLLQLLDNAVKADQYRIKKYIDIFLGSPNVLDGINLEPINNELVNTLRDMKQRNEKSYAAYLDTVKNFISNNYKQQ